MRVHLAQIHLARHSVAVSIAERVRVNAMLRDIAGTIGQDWCDLLLDRPLVLVEWAVAPGSDERTQGPQVGSRPSPRILVLVPALLDLMRGHQLADSLVVLGPSLAGAASARPGAVTMMTEMLELLGLLGHFPTYRRPSLHSVWPCSFCMV